MEDLRLDLCMVLRNPTQVAQGGGTASEMIAHPERDIHRKATFNRPVSRDRSRQSRSEKRHVVYRVVSTEMRVYAMLYTTDCLVMLLGEEITTSDCVSQKRSGYRETSTDEMCNNNTAHNHKRPRRRLGISRS